MLFPPFGILLSFNWPINTSTHLDELNHHLLRPAFPKPLLPTALSSRSAASFVSQLGPEIRSRREEVVHGDSVSFSLSIMPGVEWVLKNCDSRVWNGTLPAESWRVWSLSWLWWWFHSYRKTCQIVHFIYVQFIVRQLYLSVMLRFIRNIFWSFIYIWPCSQFLPHSSWNSWNFLHIESDKVVFFTMLVRWLLESIHLMNQWNQPCDWKVGTFSSIPKSSTNDQWFNQSWLGNWSLHKNPREWGLESFWVGEHEEVQGEWHPKRGHGSFCPFPHILPYASPPPGCSWAISFYNKPVI